MKLLVLAQTPPPLHGQSLMVQTLLEGLRGTPEIELFHVNLGLSRDSKDIGRWRPGKLFALLAACREACRLQKEHGPMALYYVPAPAKHGALYRDWLVMLYCRRHFAQLILHWHAVGLGEWLKQPTRFLERWITRRLFGRIDLSLVLSPELSADTLLLDPRHTRCVRNGIADPGDRARGVARERGPQCELLYLGLCTESKGIFDLLNALTIANACHPRGFRLTVAGGFASSEEENRFYAAAARHGEAVRYVGFADEPAKRALLSSADVFCFPTRYPHEGQPLVLIEAMAYDLPIVATQWRTLSEMLPSRDTWWAEPGQPMALADAICEARQAPQPAGAVRDHFLRYFTREQHLLTLKDALLSIRIAGMPRENASALPVDPAPEEVEIARTPAATHAPLPDLAIAVVAIRPPVSAAARAESLHPITIRTEPERLWRGDESAAPLVAELPVARAPRALPSSCAVTGRRPDEEPASAQDRPAPPSVFTPLLRVEPRRPPSPSPVSLPNKMSESPPPPQEPVPAMSVEPPASDAAPPDVLPTLEASTPKADPEGRSARQGFLWLVSGRVLRAGVSLVVGVWTARYLGPVDYGILNSALAIGFILWACTGLGLESIVRQEIVRRPAHAPVILGTCMALRVLAGALGYGLLLAFSSIHSETVRAVWLVGGLIVFSNIPLSIDYWFQAKLQLKLSTLAQNTAFVLIAILRVALVVSHAPVIWFAAAMVIEGIVGALLLFFGYAKVAPAEDTFGWDTSLARNWLRACWPLAAAALLTLTFTHLTQILLVWLSTAEEAGRYAAAARLFELGAFVLTASVMTQVPHLTRAREASEVAGAEASQRTFSTVARLAWIFALGFAVAAPLLVFGFFGRGYQGAESAIRLLGFALVPYGLGLVRHECWIASNHTGRLLIANCVGAALSVALGVACIPRWGATGASTATAVSMTVAHLFMTSYWRDSRGLARQQWAAAGALDFWRRFGGKSRTTPSP